MRLPLFLALLLAGLPVEAAKAPKKAPLRLAEMGDEQRSAALAKLVREPDMGQRVLKASAAFVGTPYQTDPLGEGPGNPPDEDPTLRWDAVDCATFVETAIAMARSRTLRELEQVLDDVRYEGAVTYSNRNHFFDAQWIPSNLRKGYLRDVTAALGGDSAATLTKTITEEQWKRRRVGSRISLPEERAPIGTFKVTYVPLDRFAELAPRIPPGTIFTVVREDLPLSPLLVTHLGFVVPTRQGVLLRHANNRPYSRVVDETLERFLWRAGRLKPWKVLGFQLFEVLDAPSPPEAGPDVQARGEEAAAR